MTLQLTRTSSEYEVTDPGGWRFKIDTYREPDRGWTAAASLRADGLREERAAIEHLRPALRALLRQLDAEFGGET
jgi:hypothetical protein